MMTVPLTAERKFVLQTNREKDIKDEKKNAVELKTTKTKRKRNVIIMDEMEL